MQWFNLMAVRTRRLSAIQHLPLFRKSTRKICLFPAIVFSLVVAVIFLYIPKLESVPGTTPVPVERYFLPLGFGISLLLLDEERKWAVWTYPRGYLAKIAR
jgi:sodium/potassium-transporting ATPase subunit alpha